MHPTEPKNLDFQIDESFTPSDDVIVDNRRYIVFATEKQLQLLAKEKIGLSMPCFMWLSDHSQKLSLY